jgi:hypothetical protein
MDQLDVFLTNSENQDLISSIVEYFDGQRSALGTVGFYTMLAEKLSRIVKKEPAWTWRYIQGAHAGSIQPSKLLIRAVNALGAALDEVPVAMAYTVQVTIYARPDTVQAGSLVLGASKTCARPGCRVTFVPNVPWRKYCSTECCVKANNEK